MNVIIQRLHQIGLWSSAVALLLASKTLAGQVPSPDCSSLVVNQSFSQSGEGVMNVPVYFKFVGLSAPPGAGIVPTAFGGFITFLPEGKLAGQITLSIGLLGLSPDLLVDKASQYSLSLDTTKSPAVCSGTIAVVVPNFAPIHFQLFVTQGGQQIEMIHTDPGLIVTVTGFPMQTSGCSNFTLNGPYTHNMKGWGPSPQVPPLSFPPEQMLAGHFPLAFTGAMSFNPGWLRPLVPGSGFVTWWDTVSANGTIVQRNGGTGWYKISPNCTGTLMLTDPTFGEDFHLELFVGKNAGTLYLVNTDTVTIPGFPAPVPLNVVAGTLNRVNQ